MSRFATRLDRWVGFRDVPYRVLSRGLEQRLPRNRDTASERSAPREAPLA